MSSLWIESSPLIWLSAHQLFLFPIFLQVNCLFKQWNGNTQYYFSAEICIHRRTLTENQQHIYCDFSLKCSLRHKAYLSYSYVLQLIQYICLHKKMLLMSLCYGLWRVTHTHGHTQSEPTCYWLLENLVLRSDLCADFINHNVLLCELNTDLNC